MLFHKRKAELVQRERLGAVEARRSDESFELGDGCRGHRSGIGISLK